MSNNYRDAVRLDGIQHALAVAEDRQESPRFRGHAVACAGGGRRRDADVERGASLIDARAVERARCR